MNRFKEFILNWFSRTGESHQADGNRAPNQNQKLMKPLTRIILAGILILTQISTPNVNAAFDDLGVGARASGMANTFVSVADDVNALYFNPAGLYLLRESAVYTQYGQVVTGLDDGSTLDSSYLGYATPLKGGRLGAIGIGYHNFKASSLLSERTLILSYGRKLDIHPFGWTGQWSGGINLKQLYREYNLDRFSENALNDVGTASGRSDPLLSASNSKAAYAVDLGGMYRFGNRSQYSTGLSLMNVNQPDVSLSGSGDKAPFITKFGIGFHPRWGLLNAEFRRIKQLSSKADTEMAFGGERSFDLGDLGKFTLRGGYGEGSRDYKAMTAGMTYSFSRATFDYSFNFPVGQFSEFDGTHRFGFSFRLTAIKEISAEEEVKVPEDFLASFNSNPKAFNVVLNRADEALNLTDYHRFLMLQLILKKHSTELEETIAMRNELAEILKKEDFEMMDWPTLKLAMFRNISEKDRLTAEEAVDRFAEEDAAFTLARMALLSPAARKDPTVQTILAMALTQRAAEAYRKKAIQTSVDNVRQLLELLKGDKIIEVAYRQLLLIRTQEKSSSNSEIEETKEPVQPAAAVILPVVMPTPLPEAPPILRAPVPVTGQVKHQISEEDATIRGFTSTLGYYLTRKSNGAPNEELLILLDQIKFLYGNQRVDMTLIDSEIKRLQIEISKSGSAPKTTIEKPEVTSTPPAQKPVVETPKVEPEKTDDKPAVVTPKAAPKQPKEKPVVAPVKVAPPVKKPAAAPVAQPVKKAKPVIERKKSPTGQSDPELKRAWDFYEESVDRGLSDSERIEILEGILLRFGETGAPQVIRELERLRARNNR